MLLGNGNQIVGRRLGSEAETVSNAPEMCTRNVIASKLRPTPSATDFDPTILDFCRGKMHLNAASEQALCVFRACAQRS